MAQLFFRYGAMNSGKSIEIIKVAHNYEEQGKSVILMTSGVDTREKKGTIASRIGLTRKALSINADSDVLKMVKAEIEKRDEPISCVLVDEAQFLNKHHIFELTEVVDQLHIPVMAFGLKNDFQNKLFEGSKYLLLYADKIEEMKTICWFCEKKAIMNLRVHDGKPVYEGEQIFMGGNESYYPVCRYHYFNPPIEAQKSKE
ncbi:thymidine kinase [Fructilactobacillus fructivorans]|uniref:Thymidine kinase n=2 Tax=Fructilactobacillus fructivorans TaxID=1614 RepID=A0AAE6P1T6_9LACO|nr:thymidine kinase [Fructilactobacillus fructivorans]MCT0151257.1 thymidine kinase [Fructilactobacillus fructivorans]MCT2867666.1 thymidine kinase [Fructilactobacillus fructivorans]MCT2868816.1 thymidine kinase [Fructilactobacillus fructivorans]MCT2874014.1 thymidine kinase [Fructilactobacillus fructivorans]QFX92917.1 thymidine kinase [Fructilactobacillus fructivorans]